MRKQALLVDKGLMAISSLFNNLELFDGSKWKVHNDKIYTPKYLIDLLKRKHYQSRLQRFFKEKAEQTKAQVEKDKIELSKEREYIGQSRETKAFMADLKKWKQSREHLVGI